MMRRSRPALGFEPPGNDEQMTQQLMTPGTVYVAPSGSHLLINAKGEYEVVTVMGSAAIKIPKRFLPQP